MNLKPLTWAAAAVAVASALAGCAAGPARTVYESAPTAARTLLPVTAPVPSPVSTQATLRGKCTTGLVNEATQLFYPLSPQAVPGLPTGADVGQAYEVTLTNTGTTAAEVTGFSAVFYDSSGDEQTSDSETFDSPAFIEPGKSLTWAETPWRTYTLGDGSAAIGPYSSGQTGAIDPGSTCQLAQWTHP